MDLVNGLVGVLVLVIAAAVLVSEVAAQNYLPMLVHKRPPPLPPLLPQQQLQQQHQLVAIPHIPDEKCLIGETEKIQCGAPEISEEQCARINCCFVGQQCYYSKAVTVQCTRDGQFVVVVARDATSPPVDVESISLLDPNDPSCGPVDATSAFAIFQFPMTACGTTIKEEEGYVVYENHMSSSYEVGVGPRGSITRDSHFELLFQCKYSDTAVEALVMEVNDLPPPLPVAAAGPLRVALRLGNGQCYSKGCMQEEAAYDSFYTPEDYPITKVLREPVYVEVHVQERTDPNLVLNLERCWATASPNPSSLPQWDLLINGCPYRDDHYTTAVVPVTASSGLPFPSHHKRFIFKMFTFVDENSLDPQRQTLFIHCATAVCHSSSTNSCEQPCHRQRKRDASAVKNTSPDQRLVVVSSGGVILTEQRNKSDTKLK